MTSKYDDSSQSGGTTNSQGDPMYDQPKRDYEADYSRTQGAQQLPNNKPKRTGGA